MNPLVQLHSFGQSFWYDNMRRKFLNDGTIQALIDNDGVRGITSNPSIFEKAIGHSDDYDEAIAELVQQGASIQEIYDALVIADIQQACDLFAPLYEESNHVDGYVSLEVSPLLANDTEGTVADARRYFEAVNRPNLMIKIPATQEGIPAIQQAIREGINVNVTLMFNMQHYVDVAQAFINGLTERLTNGESVTDIASVASFFVSRVDEKVDAALVKNGSAEATSLQGKIAIDNCKVVYEKYKDIFEGDAFAQLKGSGAQVQRLLWASTSTKNPAYSDTLYVDTLIGKDTVNTMPPNTIDAFRDHGTAADTLDGDTVGAFGRLNALQDLGISLEEITEALQVAGVESFANAFDSLNATLEQKVANL